MDQEVGIHGHSGFYPRNGGPGRLDRDDGRIIRNAGVVKEESENLYGIPHMPRHPSEVPHRDVGRTSPAGAGEQRRGHDAPGEAIVPRHERRFALPDRGVGKVNDLR